MEGDFAVKIDLENGKPYLSGHKLIKVCFLAYFHVPVHPEHRKYLTFIWNGRVFQFQVLCFGVTNAPFTFDKLGRALRDYLLIKGVRMIIYLDDILVLAQTRSQCLKDAQFVVDTIARLGFFIKRKKCILSPSKHFYFLGYFWDTMEMVCLLPPEKLQNIQNLCRECLTKRNVPVKLLQRLAGCIMAARPAVPMTRARHRSIQRLVLRHFDGTVESGEKKVRLTDPAIEDIEWWISLSIADCSMSMRSIPIWESIRLATDAMDTAIGSVLAGKVMYEELDAFTANRRIAHKEWLAFERTVRSALPELQGKIVTWHVDNMNVRQAWLNSGSVRDHWLCDKVVEMQKLLHEQNTKVVPVYVRSQQHLHADLVSRNKILPDWKLNPIVAAKVFNKYGMPEIDLMATKNSNQTKRYYSALRDNQAEGIDAFTQNWDRFKLAYVFPPVVMVELILNRIFQCKTSSRFILISPWKPKARWFPKILTLALQSPVRFPLSLNTVVDVAGSGCIPRTPTGGKMKFVAWLLSGKGGPKLENCPLGLSRLFSRAGRKLQRSTMEWGSDTTANSAKITTWTRLARLQSTS